MAKELLGAPVQVPKVLEPLSPQQQVLPLFRPRVSQQLS